MQTGTVVTLLLDVPSSSAAVEVETLDALVLTAGAETLDASHLVTALETLDAPQLVAAVETLDASPLVAAVETPDASPLVAAVETPDTSPPAVVDVDFGAVSGFDRTSMDETRVCVLSGLVLPLFNDERSPNFCCCRPDFSMLHTLAKCPIFAQFLHFYP